MKNLIIIGAGGMGREVYHLATQCQGYSKEYVIKGFLDDNPKALDGFKYNYPSILDDIENYIPIKDDIFACSIGDVKTKELIVSMILDKGGDFISLIHPDVDINITATLGKGCLVFPQVHLGSEATIGDYVMLQSYAALGHDVEVGDYSRIDPKVSCVGGVKVGRSVTLHTMSVLNHGVVVEDNAVVGAMSFVIRKVKQGITVFGIPAKQI